MSTLAEASGKYSTPLRLLLLVVLLVTPLGEVFFNKSASLYAYILVLLAPLVLLTNTLLVFLLSLATSLITASLNSPVLLVFSAITALLGFLVLYTESSTSILSRVLVSLAAFTPLYILTPFSLAPATLVLAVLLGLSAREYLRLGRSRVDVFLESKVTYLGEPARYRVVVTCPGLFKYTVLEDGKSVASGLARSRASLDLSFSCKHLGVNEKSISVLVEDVRGLAKITHGPYTLSVRVVARLKRLLKQAEKLIEEYASYLSTPRVLKVILTPTVTLRAEKSALGGAGLVGVGGFGAGISGAGLREMESEESQRALKLETRASEVQVEVEVSSTKSSESSAVKWVVPKVLLLEVEGSLSRHAARDFGGEYMGTREYVPGDNPRTIHWKKSLRKELSEDYCVKIYARERESSSGGGGVRVILADLTAVNPVELDLMLSALYGELLSELSTEKPLTQVHLFIKIPGEEGLLYISGGVVDALVALNTITRKHSLRALYNYETWKRSRIIELRGSTGFIGDLEMYYRALGLSLVKAIESKIGRRKATVQVIHSNALACKYAVITHVLKDSGFTVLKL